MKPEKAYRRQAIVALDFIQEKKTARGAGGYGSTGINKGGHYVGFQSDSEGQR